MAANLREQYEAVQRGAKTNDQGLGKSKQQQPRQQSEAKGAGKDNKPQGQRKGRREVQVQNALQEEHVDAIIPGRPFQPQKQRRDSRMTSQGKSR